MIVRSLRRRRVSRSAGLVLLAATAFGPVLSEAAAQERARAGYGPTLAERRAAVRLAQRERDAARRQRSSYRGAGGYSFGDFGGGVPDAALGAPRMTRDPRDADGVVTQVTVVVLVDGAAGVLGARVWRESLASLGVDTTVRTGRPGDAIGVTESTGVGLRTVTATGRLAAGGELVFPDRRFAPGERRALKAWVNSLTTHGAAGDPGGQPLWGLSGGQFRTVFDALAAPAPAAFGPRSGGAVNPALLALELPPTLPLRFTPEATARLRDPAVNGPAAADDGPLPAFSKGTALAALLARRGLAFHPTRTPAGGLELVVVERPADDALTPIPGTADAAEAADADAAAPVGAWPVGWKVADGPGRLAAAGGIFALTNLGVRESSLNDFAGAVEAATGVPVVLDVDAMRAVGVDPTTATVSVPPGRGAWDRAVRYAVAEHALKSELRRDEAGRGFLWITPARR